ncbi:MAG: hypothetical protein KC503_02650 [Myxococcales bacterium]|nr:hypothetical protein [Myxococcales bacterium]
MSEVEQVETAFNEVVKWLEDQGYRLSGVPGGVNNLIGAATFWIWDGAPYGCGGQSMMASQWFRYNVAGSDTAAKFASWRVETVTNYPKEAFTAFPFSGYHWVVKLTSPETGTAYLLDVHGRKFGLWSPEVAARFKYYYSP